MPRPPSRRGLFITGTDTGVGKTVATCAIAAALRRAGMQVAVSKPIATGCRVEPNGDLVSPDAEALAIASACEAPLATVNPVRYVEPLAPAVAAEKAGEPVSWAAVERSWAELRRTGDVLLIEGVGGVLVPLDERRTVLDLARSAGYPVVVVARAGLGTLNHAALTCEAVRRAGLPLAGLVVNAADADPADPAVADNPRWLAKQNGVPVLVTLPRVAGADPVAAGGVDAALVEAASAVDWAALAAGESLPPQRPSD